MSLFILLFFVCGAALSAGIAAEAGRRGSKAVALYASAMDFGAAVGPVLGWGILEFRFSPGMVFASGGILFFVAAVVSWRSFKRNSYQVAMSE